MQRRNAAELLHLADRKITDSDGPDLSLLEQRMHRLGCFFDRHQRVRPVDLVDVDVIRSKPTQGILDLLQDSRPAGITEYLSTLPFKADLGRNEHARAQLTLGYCPANDLLGAAESIGRGRVDDIDAVLQCGTDGGNGFSFIGSAPHPPSN